MSDAELGALMAEAGIDGGADDLRLLFRRVNATPRGQDPAAWVRLIAPEAPSEALARLAAACAAEAAEPEPYDPGRIDAVRGELSALSLDGFVVPRADEHQGEYITEGAERLAWLTGFNGSAGTAVLYKDKAALFVDGRYTLQAAQQVDADRVEVRHFRKPPAFEWLAGEVAEGDRIGFDPRLHSVAEAERLTKALADKGTEAVAVDDNPIDRVWRDRPPPPFAPVAPHDVAYAGRSADEKLDEIAAGLDKKGADAVVLNQLDAIAWLLNLRGGDTPNTPLAEAYAIVHASGHAELFVDPRKPTPEVEAHLGNRAGLHDIDGFAARLQALGGEGRSVLLDPATATAWIKRTLEAAGASIVSGDDPTTLPRARKNPTEIAGARAAHERDGAAVARFLRWIKETATARPVSEIEAVTRLEAFRAADPLFRGGSFSTIAGAGPNGAIVHYRVTRESSRELAAGSLFLVDSGGQYLDGTTDVTRTVAVGEPSDAMRRHFTLVLKGHIAIATARFPAGASGGQLDSLARQHLWRSGLDYDHGTGHGVGSYLGVHEGPQRISPLNAVPLEAGMIVSNEPGLYITGEYGIRIENLVVVRESEFGPDDAKFLEFETITLAPLDRRLIDAALLTADERAWLDAYHARVRDSLAPRLDGADRAWLEAATAPL